MFRTVSAQFSAVRSSTIFSFFRPLCRSLGVCTIKLHTGFSGVQCCITVRPAVYMTCGRTRRHSSVVFHGHTRESLKLWSYLVRQLPALACVLRTQRHHVSNIATERTTVADTNKHQHLQYRLSHATLKCEGPLQAYITGIPAPTFPLPLATLSALSSNCENCRPFRFPAFVTHLDGQCDKPPDSDAS